jgi:hypothetical protein
MITVFTGFASLMNLPLLRSIRRSAFTKATG